MSAGRIELVFRAAPVDTGDGAALLQAMRDEIADMYQGLDTGPRQPGARALYESEGYAEVANFNNNPVASFWGEKPLA